MKKLLAWLDDLIIAIFMRPSYEEDPRNNPVNQIPEPPKPVQPAKPLPPAAPIKPAPPPQTKYLWDTKQRARYSCRMVMDTFHLTWKEKDLLCAVIEAESGFIVRAVNRSNSDGSSDHGIVQMNSRYWIGAGKYFSSVEEVYEKPEKSVAFMCDSYKQGKLNRWAAYNNGSYKRYL